MTPAEPQLTGCSHQPPWVDSSLDSWFTFPSNTRNIIDPITCVSDWIQSQDNRDITWITVSPCSEASAYHETPAAHSYVLTTASSCHRLLLITAVSIHLHPDPSCPLPLTIAKPTLHLCRLAVLHPPATQLPCFPTRSRPYYLF